MNRYYAPSKLTSNKNWPRDWQKSSTCVNHLRFKQIWFYFHTPNGVKKVLTNWIFTGEVLHTPKLRTFCTRTKLNMLFNYDTLHTMTLLLTYMIIYNLTSFLLFSTLLQIANTKVKTLFSLSDLGSANFFTKTLSVTLLSMAGVPPLLGFFSKIFIFVLVAHSNLFVLFLPLFILLFVGLYFYVQNLRFLNSTNKPQLVLPSELSLRSNFSYYTTSLPLLFLVIFGFCYVDDLLLLSAWVLL